ncbi:MAG TPA: flagellar basal body-associated FliL family protein [Armatimonadota bacterium]|nr:flagellar basal body-associated FliL family protein [Armatimonadota bacterium]
MRFIRENNGKLPIAIIIAVVLVLVLAAGAFTFSKMAGKSKGKGKKVEKPVELSDWTLDEFIINLADIAEPHYLKVNLVLEVAVGAKGKEGEGGGKDTQEARARDAIITVLTEKHFADLLSEQGKDQLKEDLKTALNSELKDMKVENIYFTSFAMQ